MMKHYLAWGLVGASLIAAGPARAAADYYVSQRAEHASDKNPGTQERPFLTITGAFNAVGMKLKPQDCVWVLDGVYKEGVTLAPAPTNGTSLAKGVPVAAERVTLAGYPGHNPVISGSVTIDGWAPHRDKVWVAAFSWEKHKPFPIVFVDGQPLQQIAGTVEQSPERWNGRKGESLADLEPGSFFYDEQDKKIYAWLADDGSPADHAMETYAQHGGRGLSIGTGLRHFTVRNLKIRHAGLGVWGEYSVVEHVDQAWSPFVGCYLRGAHSTILNSSFDWNGNSGMGSGRVSDVRVMKCRTNHNNWRGWSGGWHAGGVKFISHSDHWIVSGHEAAYNNGDGIWFDANMLNVTIEKCVSYRNKGAGIHYEIGTRGMIRNNVCYENAHRGIYLSNASYTTVINNLAYHNGLSGIVSIGIVRGDSCGANNIIRGNILVDNCHTGFMAHAMATGVDGRGESWSSRPELILPEDAPRNAATTSDYNLIYRSGGRPIPFWKGWHVVEYPDLTAWRDATGNDMNSRIAEPLFQNAAQYDFRPATNSPALWMIPHPEPACLVDATGAPRDDAMRSAGPFEADLSVLKRIRDELPLGAYTLFPWDRMAAKVTGTPNPEKVYASRTMSGNLPRGDLGYKVMGWTVRDIPFLPNSKLASVSLHLDGDAPRAELRLGRQVKRLHLLFNAEGMESGRPFAVCTLHRDDGMARRIEWSLDSDGRPVSSPAESTGTDLAVTARRNPESPEYDFHITTWDNDNEWLPVSRMELELLQPGPAAVFRLLGVTGERGE